MLEAISNIFYDPLVFWGAPLGLALLKELGGAIRAQLRRGDPPRKP
jgi:hypothetical protein